MNVFFFEPHYALAKSYVQEVQLNSFCVPTIDGFQCPTVLQDPEQNALLKALLFTPFACTDPMACGNVLNFRNTLSNGGGETLPRLSACASQPAALSSSSCVFSKSQLLLPHAVIHCHPDASTPSSELGDSGAARSMFLLLGLTIGAPRRGSPWCWLM